MTVRDRLREGLYRVLSLTGGKRQGVRAILLYHSVGNTTTQSVPLPKFEQQMEWLQEHFQVVRLCDLPKTVATEAPGINIACLTFDDGYQDNFEMALPILESLGLKATFFIATGFLGGEFPSFAGKVAMMLPEQIYRLAQLGHEVGAHTVNHSRLTKVPFNEARTEIEDSKHLLEKLLGHEIVSFAYPKGDCDEATRSLVAANGFQLAVTTREGLTGDDPDWLMLPRVSISHKFSLKLFEAKLSHATTLRERFRIRR